ncbi:Acetolactate synthase isozyme 2 small subunit [Leclercia adecarboxylata]|uniref:Acetolactate synthase isozyme 2 small subunit n=1 Tax=Leclercia adecarboxylata TaxID=83655 RepID=A0A4U9IY41_9ENTR|nr:Acetolactate synthase isozyme 2 small subunit [Leclercia adecarboxylata]
MYCAWCAIVGFQICSMNMETATDAQNINIELTVASQRPVELLFSQLSKLVDVARVDIQQRAATSQNTTNSRLSAKEEK